MWTHLDSEQSRLCRREYFTHESWLRHGSRDGFVGTLLKLFNSGVVPALSEELILLVTGVACFIAVWNAMVGFEDFDGVHHAPIINLGFPLPLLFLPDTVFLLSVPTLGLLLGTRWQLSY